MNEIVTCPQCRRRLQLPVEHMGMEVRCPNCETAFVASHDRPLPPPPANPEAITTDPSLPRADADAEGPRPRRPRRPEPVKKKSHLAIVIGVLIVAVAVVVLIFSARTPHQIQQPHFNRPMVNVPNIVVEQPPPPIEAPVGMMHADDQKEHARKFFQHFSQMMRDQNNNGEAGCFDASRVLGTLFAQKLIPDAWQADRNRLIGEVRQGIVQTSVYRGEHWGNYEIKSVKQPRLHELIVVTRHPNPATGSSLRLRWWLAHSDGRWRIEEMEDLDFGIRLSMLVAAGLPPPANDMAFVQRDLLALRDAANAVVVKTNFNEAEGILGRIRVDTLPGPTGATHHMLMASIRIRQLRYEDTLKACDDAERLQPDMPGCDYLRSVANNHLKRDELGLKHARLAQEWFGDDPHVCFEMALALHNLGKQAQAASLYRKVLDDQPNHKDALFNLLRCIGPEVKNDDIGARFLKLKQPQNHFEEFAQDCWNVRDASTLLLLAEAMRIIEPRRPDAAFYLALAHADQQRLGPALESFGAALRLQGLDARRDHYYAEFAKTVALRDHAVEVYLQLPDRVRSFRALGEALKNASRLDDLQQLVELHAKAHPKDGYVQLYQAEVYLRDEKYNLADAAFTRALASLKDPLLEDRFRFSRIRARYMTGDVVGAYRDLGRPRETVQQLANSCWIDRKADDLDKLIEAHTKNDPTDPQLARLIWRAKILAKRYDEAGKFLKAALARKPGAEEERYLIEDFALDMVDVGQAVEAYRHAPDPALALEIIANDLGGIQRSKQLEAVLDEHRKRFPQDPILLMYAGQQAAAKEDWKAAAKAYRDGWNQLPDAKRQSWMYGYLFARFKVGQAIDVYHESGHRADYFRMLASMILADKQTDRFVQLFEAHEPQRGQDPEFAAYEARLKILRGQSAEAAKLLAGVLKDRPLHEQRRIGDSIQFDLSAYDVAAEVYLALPDKRYAFANCVWRYRTLEKAKELERLIAEHARHQPDDPRLVIERAELHMLRGEFAQAEKQFALAQGKNPPDANLARFGLMRARIKLGRTAEMYRELGTTKQTFQEIAQQCFALKDGAQLERLLVAHRQAFPNAKNLAAWDVEVHWLKKDYGATVTAIKADPMLLKHMTHRWKCESYLVRSLVRTKKSAEAVKEAEAITQRKDSPHTMLALALASTGDVPRLLTFLETKKEQRYFMDDCYHDEDLGPILRSDAFRAVQERFPPPRVRTNLNARFDDDD